MAAEENLQQRVEHLEDAKEDNEIFLLALKHWDELNDLYGFVVRVDGQIVAYLIDELIDDINSIGCSGRPITTSRASISLLIGTTPKSTWSAAF